MWQRTFWLLGSFLVLCTIPSQSEDSLHILKQYMDLLDKQELKFVDMKNPRDDKMIPKRENNWPDVTNSDEFGCWRYCVKKRVSGEEAEDEETIKRVNIIWNVVDDVEVTLDEKISSNWGIFSDQNKNLRWESSPITSEESNIFHDNDPKCELLFEIGCNFWDPFNSNFSTISNALATAEQKELVSTTNAIGLTSTVFDVNEDIEKLRILAFGKLSQIKIEIPVAQRANDSTITRRVRPMFSLSRTSDAEGFFIDARNPPLGEWRLNLSGMENLNYNFTVTSTSSEKRTKYSNEKTAPTTIAMLMNKRGDLNTRLSEMLLRPQRMAYPEAIDDDNSMGVIKMDDEQQLKNEEKLINESKTAEQSVPISLFTRALILGSNETTFPKNANLEAELMDPKTNENMDHGRINENARILVGSELGELSRSVDDSPFGKRTVVDIHPDADLIVSPGIIHNVLFTITNNQPFNIRHTFRGTSKPFPYIAVFPDESWIRAGETINVAVQIEVPNVEQTEPNVVTLYVRGNENFVEKSTYLYVRSFDGKTATDTDKPNIDYSFNDNCAGKLNRDRCSRSRWSVEITVSDTNSGLKRVTSVPSGVEPVTEFIAGTKEKSFFYYSATCCYPTVDITATDLQGNSITQRIDVTAWDNLNPGDIAAIVLGFLLLLLLLIGIILLIICCIRKRKSHDLSYSQRYGSRSPANAERSNF